jgi:D-alanine-D-alanine ligase
VKRLRVLVLMHHDLVPPDSIEGLSPEEIHPFAMEYDVLHALAELGHETRGLGVQDELAPIREAIGSFRPHIVFNLLMHFHGIGIYDAYVVSYLELLRTAYTGCNPRGLLLANDKSVAKTLLSYHRIPTPRFFVVRRGRTPRPPRRLAWPLFVKSAAEHSSTGIAQASVVHDPDSMAERVRFVHEHVGTDALVEEYVEGRELSVAVLGNQRLRTFPTWELRFTKLPEGTEPIATSKVKWDLRYQKRIGIEQGPAADLPEETAARVPRLARRVYRVLGLSGFARIDFRLAPDGRLVVLEANPNPDLCHDEDFADSAKADGLAYPELLQRLLGLGLRYAAPWKEA